LEHYGLDVHPVVLQALLLTNPITGTFFASMARLFRAYGLGARLRSCLGYWETKRILGSGGLVLASVDEGSHVGVIYAAKRSHVWFADPSIEKQNRPRVPWSDFSTRFDGEALVVSSSRYACVCE